ncbi:deoxyribonuclease NucA/NucB [Metarhizium robertsii]|uniref:Deoxyribonuclease NucA/NucB n=1 Tax=Metarhizium robertsii TaxID=568076 RepID=A0A0A1UVJ1_9HYPO|nr:deoxyribonuclease NucA/NucB [Metarhizium robertsii]
MQLTAAVALVFCALGLATPILDEPKDVGPLSNISPLFPRAGTGDDKTDPIKAKVTVTKGSKKNPTGTGGNQLTFDVDCWAILCKDAPKVLQRVVKKRVNLNRRDSRACPSPYTRKKDPITAPARNNNWAQSDFNSAEEYPFASSLQGGTGAYLVPVNGASQSTQGAELANLYRANKILQFDPDSTSTAAGASKGTWFELEFTGDLGPYCDALARGDKSVCDDKYDATGPWGFDVAKFVSQWNAATKQYDFAGKK